MTARLLVLGLAPGAHGANRTGRVFTGDASGDLLYRVLYRTGFASQPGSRAKDDGLQLMDARITCAAHCAPPGNRPLPTEIRNCRYWLERELKLMNDLQVVVALGRIAFDDYLAVLRTQGILVKAAIFGHDAVFDAGSGSPILIGSYHPSQQNTSTGRLTEEMLMRIFARGRVICECARRALPGSGLPVL